MAQTQAYLRALAETRTEPGELLIRANRLFVTSDLLQLHSRRTIAS